MNIRNTVLISLLFFVGTVLVGTVNAKTIQVGGDKVNSQEKPNRCWTTAVEPFVFLNGLQAGQQPSVAVALGLSVNNCGNPCEAKASAADALSSSDTSVENDKPVMVWYKDPKSNNSIIVNGRDNHRDDAGNIQWQQTHAQNGGCEQEQNRTLRTPCDCVLP